MTLIDMPEIDGIEAGKLFRNKNEDCKIIMLTAQSDRMREAYTEFIVGQRILRSERSLKELETELDGRLFIRIDKKYIVNFRNIDYYDKGIVSIAGKKIKVSRRKIREFEERYTVFDLRYR